MENPSICGCLVETGQAWEPSVLSAVLDRCGRLSGHVHLALQKEQLCFRSLETIAIPDRAPAPWKDGGVYLITGGLGKIGRIFALAMAKETKNATLILTGRTPAHHRTVPEVLGSLKGFSAHVAYIPADLGEPGEGRQLFAAIRESHGKLDGILHAAGIIRDGFVLKTTPGETDEVLGPKVAGTVLLDRESRDMDLDFFACFSSVTGFSGNAGQASYAAANAFMDTFAAHRNTRVARGERKGKTLSVNWPFWEQGGMDLEPEFKSMLFEKSGMLPLKADAGIRAFKRALASGHDQVMVVCGDRERLFPFFKAGPGPDSGSGSGSGKPAQPNPAPHPISHAIPGPEEGLEEKSLARLKGLFARFTQFDEKIVDVDEPFESYGIDSLMITRLNEALSEIFGRLSKTLFYEYRTLRELSGYLAGHYGPACRKWTGTADNAIPGPGEPVQKTFQTRVPTLPRSGKPADVPTRSGQEPIAVIGMNLRFPMARDYHEFWENLKNGRDCITTLPKDRWPMEDFFEPDPEKALLSCRSYCRHGGFLEDFAGFDARFFHISNQQAMDMDPQERLFLQSCWSALEDAGYTKKRLQQTCQSRVGVFAGITKSGYDLYGPELRNNGNTGFPHTSFGSVANRVSFFLDLTGPSMPVDTMCSSSLTAIHEACEHIRAASVIWPWQAASTSISTPPPSRPSAP